MDVDSPARQQPTSKFVSPDKLRRLQLDRFIPRRGSMDMSASRYLLLNQETQDDDVINKDKVRLRRELLRSLLEKVVFPEGLPNRVLLLGMSCRLPPGSQPESWPVRPRQRPCISNPDAILDLPAFDASLHLNVLDWGSGGLMAAALQQSVFLCDLAMSSTEPLTSFSGGQSTCVQWNTWGDKLAVGSADSTIQIWSTTDKKLVVETECSCMMQGSPTKCSINALAWHPNGTYFASGCSWGALISFSFPNTQDFYLVVRAHRGSICSLRSSPDGRYVASCATDGALRVWQWPHLLPHMEITSNDSSIPVLAWHPWQPSCLAVGSHCLAVYNVNNASLIAKQYFHLHNVTVYCMAWSHLTGELVVSLWVHEDELGETEEHCEVLVLATANKVVDKLEVHSNVGKVLYLMWSPDGKKIATAGVDETLQVWTFLKDISPSKKMRRHSEDFGFVIR